MRKGLTMALGLAIMQCGGLLTSGGLLTACQATRTTTAEIRPRNVITKKIRQGPKRLKIKIKMRWQTKNTYVDVETGEEMTRIEIQKRRYITIGKTIKHTKQNDYYGIKHIIHKCRKDNQQRIW
ncbi:MAG: hypothetical protein [Microviridae sp.]|nr:MAG: hypothetical protein [Microviridae sp.]